MVTAHVSQTAGKEHGEDPVFTDGLMEGNDQVFFWNGSFLEKLFHQLVFALGYQLHQCLVGGRGLFAKAYWNLGKPSAPGAVRFVHKSFHGYQVHYAAEVGILSIAFHDGQLHRNHLAPKRFTQRVHGAFVIGAGMIHLVDHDRSGQVEFFPELPHPPGHGLHPAGRVDDQQGRFYRQQRCACLVHKHGKAGRINKIDLEVAPFRECQCILHGCAARDILFVVGGYSAAVIHPAQPLGHFGGMEQRGDQGGLSAVRVTYQGDVTNVLSLIDFQ